MVETTGRTVGPVPSRLMNVEVTPVPLIDKPVLAAVMQLYLYDSSDYTGDRLDDDGRYHYHYFDLYWTEEGRFPFLIRVDGQIAGLALVRSLAQDSVPLYQMAEFFVMRPHQGQGVGRAAAVTLFDRFPGRWEVGQHTGNPAGTTFWRRVIATYTGGQYSETFQDNGEHHGPVQHFRSRSI